MPISLRGVFARYRNLLLNHAGTPTATDLTGWGFDLLEDFIKAATPRVPTLENVIQDRAERQYHENRHRIVEMDVMAGFYGAQDHSRLFTADRSGNDVVLVAGPLSRDFDIFTARDREDAMLALDASFAADRLRSEGVMMIEARREVFDEPIRLVEAPRKDRPGWRSRHDKGRFPGVR